MMERRNTAGKYIAGILGMFMILLATALMGTGVQAEEAAGRTVSEENGAEIVRFDYKSEAVNVLVTLTNPGDLPENATLTVKPVEITEEIQNSLDEQAIAAQKSIKSAKAYDITFLVDGQEVQPGNTVKVTVTTPEVAAGDEASVYHVADEVTGAVENMNGAVNPEGAVEFATPHFSTYVIVNDGTSNATVTIEHYNNTTQAKIYADDVRTLERLDKINDYSKASNWTVDHVVKVVAGAADQTLTGEAINAISVTADTVLKVYYTEKTTNTIGATTFYDYSVKPGSGETSENLKNSINYEGNYPKGSQKDNRIGVGAIARSTNDGTGKNGNDYGNVYSSQSYRTKLGGKFINYYTPTTGVGATKSGIVTGLTEDYKDVVFSVDEPGLFSDETKAGKKIYTDYKLKFQQTGDTYKLTNVLKADGEDSGAKTDRFFPINDKDHSASDYNSSNNYYFGMRYDVDFTIGDYVGPLNYSFTGDDDLWVILDGKQVVIDLGGIHDALSGSTNLWEALGLEQDGTGRTEADKTTVHRLTILYMERGGNLSNCQMNFTIPNAQILDVTNAPKADLTLNKVNSDQAPLAGASFKLKNTTTGNEVSVSSDSSGKVNFTGLKEGTYTLTEALPPDGYAAAQESWVVKVTVDEVTQAATATLYKADETTVVDANGEGSYNIINYTQQEIIQKSLNYNKTVQLTNWDARTYQIDITASSKITETSTTTEQAPIDVMLVLDKSGSMFWRVDADRDPYMNLVMYYDSRYESQLDTNKIYYVWGRKNQPMKYIDGKWLYYNGYDWRTPETGAAIYTYDSRGSALKEAASSFVTSLAENSKESKIGLSSFNTSGTLEHKIGTLTDQGELLKTLNKISFGGGTSQGEGLEIAETELQRVKGTNKQYAILFTDGEPNPSSNAALAEAEAKALKESGVTVYTIGMGMTNEGSEWLRTKIASSPECAMTATSSEELKQIFEAIQSTITNNKNLENAQITDVIDARFEITADEKARLEQNGAAVTVNPDGTTTVTWTSQTIPNENNTDNNQWNRSINVRAKDNYIGGNDVTTNVSPNSLISTSLGNATLPQPTVNVKVDLLVNDIEKTIFWGESTPWQAEVLNQAFNVEAPTGTVNGQKQTYTQFTQEAFTIKWYKDAACTEEMTETEIADLMTQKPEIDTAFYLKVLYNPGQSTVESLGNTTKDGKGYIAGDATAADTDSTVVAINEKDAAKNYGTYTIHVVKGQLVIEKTIDKGYTSIDAINANATFVFKIDQYAVNPDGTKGDRVRTFHQTISFDANDKEKTKSAIISGLEKGFYTVTEETAWTPKYKIQGGETSQEKEIGFDMKQNNPNNLPTYSGLEDLDKEAKVTNKYQNHANGEHITTDFTNNLSTTWKWLSDSAIAINQFTN